MMMKIGCVLCCWGVDDVKNLYLLLWWYVFVEVVQVGYLGIEFGLYGYILFEFDVVSVEFECQCLSIMVGMIFDDFVLLENLLNLLCQMCDICVLIM